MKTTTRRYTSPNQAPRLSTTARPDISGSAGIVCLHARPMRQPVPLVTFEWGRVASSRRGR